MSSRRNAASAARKGFAAAMEELEAVVAKRMRAGAAPRAAAPGFLPGLDAPGPAEGHGGDAAGLSARVAELEAALSLAERERDAARAALTALRAARAEEARLVDEALRDLRQAV